MRYLFNLTTYITVEAATLIALALAAATSYIMARKRKTGTPKPPQSTASTGTTISSASAAGTNQAAVAAPVIQEVDTRPETSWVMSKPGLFIRSHVRADHCHAAYPSPYGSPACTVPFASPLTVPLDILKKSPKLHAAYEGRLPELPAIPEDVGHVLVHYLHTGTYGSLRPKPTDTLPKQVCELKTSIQAYAAARAYHLPDLMRLAEAKIDKYGNGLPLPALLEVARDAYPTLAEGDSWFLDYLRSRIRPHLKDPKSLLASNLLDQVSRILSPNRVLLRTVLELFCERIVAQPESVTSPGSSTIASPITSLGSSRPVSPMPPPPPMSLLQLRTRAMFEDESPPPRKNLKATPWPSPDNMSEASWATSMSPDQVIPEIAPPQFEAKPMPEPTPVLAPFPELGPVIIDVVPPPGPSIMARSVVEAPAKTETTTIDDPKSELEIEDGTIPEPATGAPRARKDSGKGIDWEPPLKELDSIPELIPEIETEFSPQSQIHRSVIREADSGFWEAPDVESGKEPAPSLVGLEPVPVPISEPAPSLVELELVPVSIPETAHELESTPSAKDTAGIEIRDFAAPDSHIESNTDGQAEAEPAQESEVLVETLLVPPPVEDSASETLSKDAPEPKPALEPLPIKPVELVPERLTGTAELVTPETTPAGELPARTENKEVEAQPEIEKVDPLPKCREQESWLTIRQVQKETVEPEAVAKAEPEPEPTADSSDPVHLPDTAEPAGSFEPKTAQPSFEPGPEPAGKPEVQRANSNPTIHSSPRADDVAGSPTVLGAKPAPEQEGTKTEADTAGSQPCSAQVRQRSWKKRFLSVRYPALFGRGM